MNRSPLFCLMTVLVLTLHAAAGCAGGGMRPPPSGERPETAADAGFPALIPQPVRIRRGRGPFPLDGKTVIRVDRDAPGLLTTARILAERLQRGAGLSVRVEEADPARPAERGEIRLTLRGADPVLGEEGYTLRVSEESVLIRAPWPAGVFYGTQTLRQLLPPSVENPGGLPGPGGWTIPAVEIWDRPRYEWRGMLLDSCRHFMTVDFVKRYVDLLASLKMNRLHWHLTEDQGWRIEIRRYPRLTEVGAWRGEGEERYGGFYTQEQIRDVVRYAAERGITVVPEIEMPGHSTAALAAYPHLSCTGGPFEVGTRWGVYDDIYCAGKDSTFIFLQDVLTEVLGLFPSPWIHIGADEAPKVRWQAHELDQKRIREEGLEEEHGLQSWFVERIARWLGERGRRIIGWDEVMEGGTSAGTIVQYWRTTAGDSTVFRAASEGHQVISSPTSHCYFDYPYSTTPLEQVYTFDPAPGYLRPSQRERVLGGEFNMWTERAPQRAVDRRMFPRLLAGAEVLWSPEEGRDYSLFLRRVSRFYPRLHALGVDALVPPPRIEAAGVLEGGSGGYRVRLLSTVEGAETRYTTDGTGPDGSSTLYRGSFHLEGGGTVRAVSYLPGFSVSEPASATFHVGAAPAADPGDLVPGLSYTYLEARFRRTADMDTEAVSGEGSVPVFTDSPRRAEDGYGFRYEGFIRVPEDGAWTFSIRSDDGSVLRIGGIEVVDNDGLHGVAEVSGTILLRAGLHPVEARFFEAGGADLFEVRWEGPGVPRQIVPEEALFRTPR
ncbi:MAG: family 20 glycosylhydrolase [bacterium]